MTHIASVSPMSNSSQLQEMVHNKNISEDEKMKAGLQQFESLMLNTFLKDSLKPMQQGYLNESGSSHDIYRSLFTQSIAEKMSQGGGIGISSVLQTQLQKK